jgi:DNA-binding cell septation regulator SpoVG
MQRQINNILFVLLCYRKTETQQFHDVAEHPAFKANPMAALQEHVANRLRQANAEREQQQREIQRVQRRDQKATNRLQKLKQGR